MPVVSPLVLKADTSAPARRIGRATHPAATGASSSASDALAQALTIVGDRWSLAVVAQLVAGPQRFNDLATDCAPIARTVLSERLRRLEDAGIVMRKQYSDTPPRSNYRLSVSGAELARVCGVLADWSSRHLGEGAAVMHHTACGSPVQPAYACVECGPIRPRDVISS